MAQPPPPHVSHHIAPNWPPFPHPGANGGAGGGGGCQPSWVDEFLEFSSTRRGAHRRSASDSIAFLEGGEYQNSVRHNGGYGGFDRLDDEQLMSMFSEDGSMTVTVAALPPPPSSSAPSTPSDQNSNSEEIKPAPANADPTMRRQSPKTKPGTLEADSSCKAAQASSNADAVFDPRRVKRILANRQSAQRSRVRKLQYISELERSVTTLQSEVSELSPRVAFLDHQRLILNVDNSALKQRIAALAQDKIFKDAQQEALKKEIERLRRVYQQQNVKKTADVTATTNPSSPTWDPPERSDNNGSKDKDQLLHHQN
ncbi:basic leucine zipper 6 [Eucalyptus grandis]|uniref:basic leucine zipper 6 n=1 Tax=Eucalyptus grandis TaxID=71139 RepID=UPI00192ED01E|nr:basic leucine zipper 6 [Eucalyptus grandis]